MSNLKHLISKSLYQKRKMMIWWFIALIINSTFTLYFYPSLKSSNIGKVFNSLPNAIQRIIGGSNSFSSLTGYITQEIFALRVPLLTIILSITAFYSLTAVEERKGLLETQITLPLSRSKILLGRLISALLIIIISSLGTFLGIVLGLLLIHDHYSTLKIIEYCFESLLISIDFGLIVLFLYSKFGPKSIVLGLSSALALGSYLISSIVTTHSGKVASIEKLSLFHYYNNLAIYNAHHLNVLLIFGLVLIILSFLIFRKRDVITS